MKTDVLLVPLATRSSCTWICDGTKIGNARPSMLFGDETRAPPLVPGNPTLTTHADVWAPCGGCPHVSVSALIGLETLSGAHACAHAPQFWRSELTFTHPLGHCVVPPAQPHEPPVQTALVPHDLPSPATGFVHCPVPALHVPAVWH